jgi:ABC-type branched-subunit amino acid transport system ATPase component
MLTTHSEGIFARQADLDGSTVPLHNVDRPEQENAIDSENSTPPDAEGRWGERDAGAPVSMQQGMEEYEELRKELTRLSTLRSRPAAGRDALWRSVTGASRATVARTRTREASVAASVPADEIDESQQDDFALGDFLREGHFEKRTDGRSAKKIGVTFKHLTVKGFASSATKAKTLPKAVLGTFGPDLYRLITGLFPVLRPRSQQPLKEIIHDFTGGLRDGEMMLVLGRPGSGCSTFLKTVANNRAGYAEVTGDVKYGGISAKEQAKRFRGEVTYNAEDDQHFATLTVWQTLKFALSTKTRKQDKEEVPILINALLKMFGLPHTANTLVGNEYVRGVSGGERKRVSITEMLATKATVVCWDNSTRGLDVSLLDKILSHRLLRYISR